jgi:DNA-binding IclR family transcriptional regulator
MSDEEAQDAVLQFVQSHTGADACDIADALNLPIRRAFTIVDALIEAGKLEVDGG